MFAQLHPVSNGIIFIHLFRFYIWKKERKNYVRTTKLCESTTFRFENKLVAVVLWTTQCRTRFPVWKSRFVMNFRQKPEWKNVYSALHFVCTCMYRQKQTKCGRREETRVLGHWGVSSLKPIYRFVHYIRTIPCCTTSWRSSSASIWLGKGMKTNEKSTEITSTNRICLGKHFLT